MKIQSAPTHWARIYMAGSLADAERVIRDWAFNVGGCVTLSPAEYIYSGGQESGFVVGFINYPRFPSTPDELREKAELLATLLANGLNQKSWTVETPAETRWFSRAMPFEMKEAA